MWDEDVGGDDFVDVHVEESVSWTSCAREYKLIVQVDSRSVATQLDVKTRFNQIVDADQGVGGVLDDGNFREDLVEVYVVGAFFDVARAELDSDRACVPGNHLEAVVRDSVRVGNGDASATVKDAGGHFAGRLGDNPALDGVTGDVEMGSWCGGFASCFDLGGGDGSDILYSFCCLRVEVGTGKGFCGGEIVGLWERCVVDIVSVDLGREAVS